MPQPETIGVNQRPAPAMRLAALLMTTVSALAVTQTAHAQCVVNPATPYTNSGAIACLTFDDGANHSGNVTNAATGTITTSTEDGIDIQSGTTLEASIVNNGTITVSGGNATVAFPGVYIQSSTVEVSLVNNGNITAATRAIELNNATIGGAIDNSGNLTTTTGYGAAIYIVTGDVSATSALNATVVSGGIFNASTGMISGANAGVVLDGGSANSAGVTVDGGIVNDGNISGAESAGIYLSGGAGNLAQGGAAIVNGGITNNGNITAGAGVGLALAGAEVNGGITNSGLIAGVLYGLSVSDTAISGDIDNTASGTIGATDGSAIAIVAGNDTVLTGASNSGTSTITGNTLVRGNIVNAGAVIISKGKSGSTLTARAPWPSP